MVVCTLCSCYPWDVLGLPPVWYKSAPYRSRAVMDPRGVLADFGVTLPSETEIRVWDSTAETRFMVLPQRPPGTEGWSEERLASLVTRDSMIGTGSQAAGGGLVMNGVRHGRHARVRKGDPSPTSRRSMPSGRAACWLQRAIRFTRAWNIDMSRDAKGRLPARSTTSGRPTISDGLWGWAKRPRARPGSS
jgi:hypothetical protein